MESPPTGRSAERTARGPSVFLRDDLPDAMRNADDEGISHAEGAMSVAHRLVALGRGPALGEHLDLSLIHI